MRPDERKDILVIYTNYIIYLAGCAFGGFVFVMSKF